MASENTQNYANHARLVPGFHYLLFGLILLGLIGSCVNLYMSLGDHQRIYSASLIVVLELVVLLASFFCRTFALKAQDRAIRAEENLRHFVLAGKLLDPRLGTLQIVALRFASDTEFVKLAAQAAEQNLQPKAIKQAIKNWRGDYYRV